MSMEKKGHVLIFQNGFMVCCEHVIFGVDAPLLFVQSEARYGGGRRTKQAPKSYIAKTVLRYMCPGHDIPLPYYLLRFPSGS